MELSLCSSRRRGLRETRKISWVISSFHSTTNPTKQRQGNVPIQVRSLATVYVMYKLRKKCSKWAVKHLSWKITTGTTDIYHFSGGENFVRFPWGSSAGTEWHPQAKNQNTHKTFQRWTRIWLLFRTRIRTLPTLLIVSESNRTCERLQINFHPRERAGHRIKNRGA